MTHSQIYYKLEEIEQRLYVEYEQIGFKDKFGSLQHILLRSTMEECDRAMDIFEKRKKFCASCLYTNLTTLQKALARYFELQPTIPESEIPNFVVQYEAMNKSCQELREITIALSHESNGQECVEVKNTVYPKIKGRKSIRAIRFEEESQDDDDDEYLSLN